MFHRCSAALGLDRQTAFIGINKPPSIDSWVWSSQLMTEGHHFVWPQVTCYMLLSREWQSFINFLFSLASQCSKCTPFWATLTLLTLTLLTLTLLSGRPLELRVACDFCAPRRVVSHFFVCKQFLFDNVGIPTLSYLYFLVDHCHSYDMAILGEF